MIKEYVLIHKEDETIIDVISSEEELKDTLEILDKAGYKDKIHIQEWTINDD